MKRVLSTVVLLASAVLFISCGSKSSQDGYTRGLGVYPGDPSQTFAPEMVACEEYGNIAAFKAAYHSSSYDYNLTAQLATDGIISANPSPWIGVSTSNGPLAKREREWMFDDKSNSGYTVTAKDLALNLDIHNMEIPADQVRLVGSVSVNITEPQEYSISILASTDGKNWDVLGEKTGSSLPGTAAGGFRFGAAPPVYNNPSPVTFLYDYVPKGDAPVSMGSIFGMRASDPNISTRPLDLLFDLPSGKGYSHYSFMFKIPAAESYTFYSWDLLKDGEEQFIMPSMHFNSSWKSAEASEQWIYVDFGAKAKYNKVVLNWINKAVAGKIQQSDDAVNWTDLAPLPGGDSSVDEINVNGSSRYVRVLAQESANGEPYELTEIQVFGKGGLRPQPKEAPAAGKEEQYISGGKWKLQRANLVKAEGAELSKIGFNDSDWVVATVPGTVLGSFINNGSVPDPNVADNQLMVSESYFESDFWYRDEFEVSNESECTFLNFNGINWKAEAYLNGEYLGLIEGAFKRGKFDVSKYIVKGTNALAVRIIRNAHPGAIKEQDENSADMNGGAPGADNPTFHATIGWDWIPTIRGRSIGIWNDVFLTFNGPVTVEDPFIRAELPLPDTTSANLFVELTLKNHKDEPVSGVVKGQYGDAASFQTEVSLNAGEEKIVKLDAGSCPELHLVNPKLWWPNGYGEQNLYDVSISFEADGKVSDVKNFKSGVRQMEFSEDEYAPSGGMQFFNAGGTPKRLTMKVNGRRFIGFGGNWGFSETNLNYKAREYDIAVKYHADMNFTMIRDWVGQIGDEEFYDACDKYGIMVWQDFWLANPGDGQNPYYPEMFLDNARDYVKRIRNHASIGIYVGRNEGNPPEYLDKALRDDVVKPLHPGLYYIPHSSSGSVSGGGPYRALAPKQYFALYGHDKMHSERGMPTVMTYENMVRAFGEENIEPVNTAEHPNNIYGMHDYTLTSAQGADSFNQIIAKAFGEPKDAKEFAKYAQLINYNGYRAIFEGRSEHRRGMILWMSHPAWPSMVWQTYDYYFEPTGSYYGSKKACEPIHIQWNPLRDDVEVVNYHTKDWTGLTAKAQVIDETGAVKWEKEVKFDILDDQTVACFPLEFDAVQTESYFIRLTLTGEEGLLSENFYIAGKEEGNFQSLTKLPQVTLTKDISLSQSNGEWIMKGTVRNDSQTPAVFLRLKLTGDKSNDLILPVIYNDNYFSLMPGESKKIEIRFRNEDTRGEHPTLSIEGINAQ